MKDILRIIPKDEIFTQSKSSLAGKCGVKFYYDGNMTFSYQASILLNFEEKHFFELVENKKGDIFLISNNISGYKPRKRKGKSCFIYNSPSFIKYMFKRFNVELKKGNSLEFLIKKTPLKIENQICFKLIIQ